MTSKASIYEAVHLLDQVVELDRANRDALPGEAVRLVKSARAKLRKKLRSKVTISQRRDPEKVAKHGSEG